MQWPSHDDHRNQTIQERLAYEAPGVQPVFRSQQQAIVYAICRACFRSGEVRILDSGSNLGRIIPFDDTERKL